MQFIRGRVHIQIPEQDKKCQRIISSIPTITIGQRVITKIIMALLRTCET